MIICVIFVLGIKWWIWVCESCWKLVIDV